MLRVREWMVALLTLAMLALSACGSAPKSAPPGGTSGGSQSGSTSPAVPFKTLTIAFRGDADTLDPDMRAETTTENMQQFFYEFLVVKDRDGKLVPQLAESWNLDQSDKSKWIFHLRQNVHFHDGSTFTAADAAFSVMRAKTHPKSQMAQYVTTVKEARAVDPNTLEIDTTAPSAVLLEGLVLVPMLSKAYVDKAGDQEMAVKPMGTGPYKFVEWVKSDHMTAERFDGYWGSKPVWEKVTTRPIPDNAARIAALISGQVQVAETIDAEDVPRVKSNPDLKVVTAASDRIIYLTMNWAPNGTDGMIEPKDKNPFTDVRVRKAIYMGIDENAIIQSVMGGFATAATQYTAPPVFGYNKSIQRPAYDPDGAKKLLADAGYPNGFKVRLDGPNDRYINDKLIEEAIAGQLAKIGVQVTVNSIPKSQFFPQVDKGKFTMYLAGWGTANQSATLNAQVHTKEGRIGVTNRNHFSNKDVDQAIEQGDVTFDDNARAALYQKAIQISQGDMVNWVPLHQEQLVDGISAKLDWTPRWDETIFPWEIKPAAK